MTFGKVKPDSTPNVNFPETGVSKDLSLGEAFHLHVFYTWVWTRDEKKEDIEEKLQ